MTSEQIREAIVLPLVALRVSDDERLRLIVEAARAYADLLDRPTEHSVLAWIEEPYEAVDGAIMPLSVVQIVAPVGEDNK